MPYPAGILTRQISFGSPRGLEAGVDMTMNVYIIASRSMLWTATGDPFVNIGLTIEGFSETLALPVTDQSGWGDGLGNDYSVYEGAQTHTYSIAIVYKINGSEKFRRTIPAFALPSTSDAVVDIDNLIQLGPPTEGVQVPGLIGELPEYLTPTALADSIADSIIPTRVEAGVESGMTITTLMSTPDEAIAATNCSIGADREHFIVGDRGIRMDIPAAVSARITMDPMQPLSPLSPPPADVVGLWVWLDDHTKVNSILVDVRTVNADNSTNIFNRTNASADRTLRTGWNLLRYPASSSSIGEWVNVDFARVSIITNAATRATVGQLWLESPQKAGLIIINDGASRSYDEVCGAWLRQRGLPMTWAIGCSNTETAIAASPMLTIAELHERQAVGDSVSFHNYGSSSQIMSTATADEVRLWTWQAQKWLQAHGFNGWFYRAAWLQNTAPQAAAAYPLLAAAPTNIGGSAPNTWPLCNRMAYPRITLHGKTFASLDADFETLKKTRGLYVVYTHHLDDGGGVNLTNAEWNYFRDKVDAAVDEGWLEGVTFETLFARSGARWKQSLSGPLFKYRDEYGRAVTLGTSQPAATDQSVAPSGAWDPKDVNSVVAWYDPTNTGAADGATLTKWEDSTPAENSLTTVIGAPTYDADGLAGTPAVAFNGSSAFILPEMRYQDTGVGPVTLMFNFQLSSTAVSSTFFDGGPTDHMEIYGSGASKKWSFRRGVTLSVAPVPLIDTSAHTMLVEFNDAASRIILDGAEIRVDDLGVTISDLWHVGQRNDGTNRLNGALGDFMVVKGVLSLADRSAAESWFLARRTA